MGKDKKKGSNSGSNKNQGNKSEVKKKNVQKSVPKDTNTPPKEDNAQSMECEIMEHVSSVEKDVPWDDDNYKLNDPVENMDFKTESPQHETPSTQGDTSFNNYSKGRPLSNEKSGRVQSDKFKGEKCNLGPQKPNTSKPLSKENSWREQSHKFKGEKCDLGPQKQSDKFKGEECDLGSEKRNAFEVLKWSNKKDTSKSKDDGFEIFEKSFKLKKIENFKHVIEIEGDLFAMPEEYSLAHCVAEDMNMGSGIAVNFRQSFGRVDELLQQRKKQGNCAVLDVKERFIYYLITKRESSKKPTLSNMYRAVYAMKQHIVENNVKKIAIPRIGCGLDRLEWSEVKNMLEYIFTDTEVLFTVCNFQQNYGKAKQTLQAKIDAAEKKGKDGKKAKKGKK